MEAAPETYVWLHICVNLTLIDMNKKICLVKASHLHSTKENAMTKQNPNLANFYIFQYI